MSGKVALACKVCASRNYTTHKSSKIDKRLEVKKYCKYCGKHTLHGETK